ncbi:hypothetical protein YC2023_016402 [Brassica napus]
MFSESDGDGDRKNTVRLTERKDGFPIQVQSSVLSQSEEVKGDSVWGLNCDSVASPSKSGVKSSYSAVVEGAPATAEEPEFVVKDGIVEIAIPAELLEDVEPLWKCFVVGYFMNDARHIGSIHATINRIWSLQGKCNQIDVQFIGKTTVLFQTEDVGVQSRVLKRKFWHITELMEELESLSEKDNLSNVGISISEKDNTSEQWATIPCQAVQAGPSTGVETNDCLSPNGFHVLQDIREDGEIDDDEENNEDEVKQSTDEVVGNDFVADLTYTTSVVSQRQCSSQRSRSRGTKKTIVNSRALV